MLQLKALGKRIFIHVGMPKTATTFLQDKFFPRLAGVHYIGKGAYGHLSQRDILGNLDRIARTNPNLLNLDIEAALIGEMLRTIADERILISHERLFGNMNFSFFDHSYIANSLQAIFPEATIVVIVRRQDELLESLYRQTLRNYFYEPVDRYLGFLDGRFRPPSFFPSTSLPYPSHHAVTLDLERYCRNYMRLFGADNVAVLPYELLKAEPQRFFEALCSILGVPPYVPDFNNAVYPSYSLASSRASLLLNRFVRTKESAGRFFRFIPDRPFSAHLNRRLGDPDSYPYAFYESDRTRMTRMDRLLDSVNRRISLSYFLENVVDRLIPMKGDLISEERRRLIMQLHRTSNAQLDAYFSVELHRFGYY